MGLNVDRKWIETLERVFVYLLLAYVTLGFCNLTYGETIVSYVMYPAFLLGGALVLWRLVHWREYVRMPLLACALLFLLSYAVSCAVNAEYFTKQAAVYFLLWCFYFLLLYTQPNDRGAEDVLAGVRRFSLVFLGLTAVLVGISLWMLATGYWWAYRDPNNNGYEIAAGFFSGRLWGAFQDPIHGSVMCCASIAACWYWFRRRRERWLRVLLAAGALVFVFYIAVSDSRNGMLCFGLTLCLLFVLSRPFGERGWTVRKRALCVLLAVLLLVGAVFLVKGVQMLYNGLNDMVGDDLHRIERGYDTTSSVENFGNRRLDIWRSAVEIALCRPVFGVSFVGVVPFALEHLPQTYIVSQPDYWIINTLESELFNTLAGQGFVGLAILAAWAVLAAVFVFRRFRSVPAGQRDEITLLTSIVCMLLVSAQFQGVMLHQVTPNSVLFWAFFGALLFLLRKSTET